MCENILYTTSQTGKSVSPELGDIYHRCILALRSQRQEDLEEFIANLGYGKPCERKGESNEEREGGRIEGKGREKRTKN